MILLGDPLQLAQVSQGTHLEGAGASVLEHLLGDHPTVPPDMGIFLDRTRRMHPDVCGFVSDAENVPRSLEFLFSRNRLNVAVSRAMCLACIVAHPRLLESRARTIEVKASCLSRWRSNGTHGRRRSTSRSISCLSKKL